MVDKRNPTDRTEERGGDRGAGSGPDLPEDAEHGEYADYRKEQGGSADEEARREAELQPDEPGASDQEDDPATKR